MVAFPPTSRDEVDGNEELMRPIESRDNGKSSADGIATPPGDEHLDVNAFDHPATYEVSCRLAFFNVKFYLLVPDFIRNNLLSGYQSIHMASTSMKLMLSELLT